MDRLWQDVRDGLRMLRSSPGVSAVAIVMLALGIGGNAAMFSLANGVLLRPLPYADSARLVRVEEHHVGSGSTALTYANYLDLKRETQTLVDVSAYRWWTFNLTADGDPESVQGATISAEYFAALRLETFLGRFFSSEEDRPGRPCVIVIGHGLWQRRCGSDPQAIGRIATVNNKACTIVGVMPAGFREPFQAEIWAPLVATGPFATNRRSHLLTVMARLRPRVTVAVANAEVEELARRMDRANPGVDPGLHISVASFQERAAAPVRPLLLVLSGAVACLLLIACANLGNLLLARSVRRSREFAVRAALGASRWRLVRQLLAESLLLAVCGAGLGLFAARWALTSLEHLLLSSVSGFSHVSLDWRVHTFAAALTLIAGTVCAVAPALEGSRLDIQQALNDGSRGSTGVRQRRLRNLLVIAELALALVLLIGAGLLLETFRALTRVPLGFEPHNVLTMNLFLPPTRYPQGDPRAGVYLEQIRKRLESVPGVRSVGTVDWLPLLGGAATDLDIPGLPPSKQAVAEIHMTSPGYFQTVGIPLLEGRWFDERDTARSPTVMMISQRMAREFWPGQDPIGHQVTMKDWGPPLTGTIVAVVGDVKLDGLEAATRPPLYWPCTQFVSSFSSLVVRTETPPSMMVPLVKAAIWSVNREQTIASIETMEDVLSEQLAPHRFHLGFFGAFAGLAVLLSSLGVYSVLAQSVEQRRHEMGIRMALGARQSDVLGLVVMEGLKLSLLGVGLGVAASVVLTRSMASLLFGVGASDPRTFAGAAVLLILVALAACYGPALRATRTNAVHALTREQ